MASIVSKRNPVLLIYKQSSLSVAGKLSGKLKNTKRFEDNHRVHYASLNKIEAVLRDFGVVYHKKTRNPNADYSAFGLIITVGGDGTVLDVARNTSNSQLVLGVNSDPNWSIGQFCSATALTFEEVLSHVLKGTHKISRLYKLKAVLNDGKTKKTMECLNDILICHSNPAAMSRYELTINGRVEEQRSSGVWFSSAAGSTGAILSAGGKKLPISSLNIQYKPRELYHSRKNSAYHLTGGVIGPAQKAVIVSYMPRGSVFIDGAHVRFPFTYSHKAEISHSSHYVQLVNA
ncbi:MAG: NAD(+)/NADH kinase [Candidatus Omnitrophica bacterium]|nr:NAD(+)/NADH kinase [Candidatus Omnitrophota bacterium]